MTRGEASTAPRACFSSTFFDYLDEVNCTLDKFIAGTLELIEFTSSLIK